MVERTARWTTSPTAPSPPSPQPRAATRSRSSTPSLRRAGCRRHAHGAVLQLLPRPVREICAPHGRRLADDLPKQHPTYLALVLAEVAPVVQGLPLEFMAPPTAGLCAWPSRGQPQHHRHEDRRHRLRRSCPTTSRGAQARPGVRLHRGWAWSPARHMGRLATAANATAHHHAAPRATSPTGRSGAGVLSDAGTASLDAPSRVRTPTTLRGGAQLVTAPLAGRTAIVAGGGTGLCHGHRHAT